MHDLYIEAVEQADFRIDVDGTVEPGDGIADLPIIDEYYDANEAYIRYTDEVDPSMPLSAGVGITWHYEGEITNIDIRSGSLNLELNGQSVTPGQLEDHYNYYPMDRVVLLADMGTDVEYTATVSGSLSPASGFDGNRNGSTITDTMAEGEWSDFYYDGDVTEFDVSSPDVSVFHNCEPTDPDDVIAKTPPTAAFSTEKNYLDVAFDAAPSSRGSHPIDSYDWVIDGQTYSGSAVSHTFGSSGTYDVSLTVTDTAGQTDTTEDTVSVDAEAVAPTAAFSYNVSDRTISLDGRSSNPGTGSITSYEWSIDGATRSGSQVTYTVDSAGDYSVTLTVTNSEGLDDQTSETISVDVDDPPRAGIPTAAAALGLGALAYLVLSDDDDTMRQIKERIGAEDADLEYTGDTDDESEE